MEGKEINFLSERYSAQIEIALQYDYADKESYSAPHTS